MGFNGKKILVVAPDFPYPPNHGGRLDLWGRILALRQLGFAIDLVATVKESPTDKELAAVQCSVQKVMLCPRTIGISDFLSITPLQAASRRTLKEVPLGAAYDLLLLESEYGLPILDNPNLRVGAIVLRLHNDEEVYLQELCKSTSFGLRKFYYWLESFKCGRLKLQIVDQINNMMFISHDEFRRFTSKFPHKNAIHLPASLPSKISRKMASHSRKVLFIGSLFMVNNREAVDWYLKWVHPGLLDIQGYELVVAGNCRGEAGNWYKKLTHGERITLYKSPADLGPLYGSSALFVNPMRHGAGVKLKVIDALINGLPVVSTTVGAQGTGLTNEQHVQIADEPAAFANCVKALLLNPCKGQVLVANAQQYMAEQYNQAAVLEKFLAPLVG